MAGERTLSTHHTLSVLVENQPGVLSRVSGLFSRRGFNIESLAVGPTEREDRSRITIRVDCSQTSIDQVIKQLYKLINVLKVNELGSDDAIERELLLVKVTRSPDRRAELVSLADVFGARVVDVGACRDDVRDRGASHQARRLRGAAATVRDQGDGAHRPRRHPPLLDRQPSSRAHARDRLNHTTRPLSETPR